MALTTVVVDGVRYETESEVTRDGVTFKIGDKVAWKSHRTDPLSDMQHGEIERFCSHREAWVNTGLRSTSLVPLSWLIKDNAEWFRDYSNVVQLGEWLADNWFTELVELQRYYAAPWKWTEEWNELQTELADTPATVAAAAD
jgi:hypothetical protein